MKIIKAPVSYEYTCPKCEAVLSLDLGDISHPWLVCPHCGQESLIHCYTGLNSDVTPIFEEDTEEGGLYDEDTD